MNMTPSRPFSESWTLSDSQQFFGARQSRPHHESPEYGPWLAAQRPLTEKLMAAVGEHILYLANTGKLNRIDPLGLNVSWINAWNRLVDGKNVTPRDIADASRPFRQSIIMSFSIKDVPSEQAHDHLVACVEAGTWEWFENEYTFDSHHGEHVFADLKGWSVTLGRMANGPVPGDSRFEPFAVPFKPHGLIHQTIEVPSGELMVADWFRVDAFTGAMKKRVDEKSVDYGKNSLNSMEGRERRILAYAKEGVAHFSVGNSSPRIFASQGCLILGYLDDDGDDETRPPPSSTTTPANLSPSSPQLMGSTCTDLWWVTAADKTTVLSIMADEMGDEAAREALDAYLATKPYGLSVIHVKPGTYHLYAAASAELFEESFATPDVDVTPFSCLMGVLSSKPLTLVPSLTNTLGETPSSSLSRPRV